MTVSFHKYGDFFPGSGALDDIGYGAGRYCSVNVPLLNGLDDFSFENIFKPVLTKVFDVYQPSAVVMCCGADSIAGDRLGCWNMSLRGHGAAVDFVKTFNVPIVLLGGGGYTPRNVARCWAYETAVALGNHNELKDEIPMNEMYTSYGPSFKFHLDVDSEMENKNVRAYFEPIVTTVLENLSQLKGPPSVPFQDVPRDFYADETEDPSEQRPDEVLEERRDPTAYPAGTECAAGNLVD
jgi:histone deacetylase 1/2